MGKQREEKYLSAFATTMLKDENGREHRYKIKFTVDQKTGHVMSVLSESCDKASILPKWYMLVQLMRQLYVKFDAPIPKRYGATVTYTERGANQKPVLLVSENNKVYVLEQKAFAKDWLTNRELKRIVCFMHWLEEINPDLYSLVSSGDPKYENLRPIKWNIEFQ